MDPKSHLNAAQSQKAAKHKEICSNYGNDYRTVALSLYGAWGSDSDTLLDTLDAIAVAALPDDYPKPGLWTYRLRKTISRMLYRASAAGVEVRLIVRGFCCLRPGVPGLSENIRVRSVIGRFLEHSRVFYFANGNENPAEGDFWFGSADWMHRNLNHRVEAATPVLDPSARERLWHVLDVLWRDRRNAWEIDSDGGHTRIMPDETAEIGTPEASGTFASLMADVQT